MKASNCTKDMLFAKPKRPPTTIIKAKPLVLSFDGSNSAIIG